jgi:hypothetical protein
MKKKDFNLAWKAAMLAVLLFVQDASQSLPIPWNSDIQTCLVAQTLGTSRNNYGGSVGITFTCTNNCHVVALGFWVTSGAIQNNCIALVGNATTVTTNISAAGKPVGYTYSYLSTPFALTAGFNYTLTMEVVNGGDSWYDDNTTVVVNPMMGYATAAANDGATSALGTCGTSTTLQLPGANTYGPVNLLFTIP